MKTDTYGLAINDQTTYEHIAGELSLNGICLVSWTDGEVHFDILFAWPNDSATPDAIMQGGIQCNWLYVSIMRMGAFAFKTGETSHPNYYAEKLGLQFDGGTRQALGELINGVRALL